MRKRNLRILTKDPQLYPLLMIAFFLTIFTAGMLSLIPARADGSGGFPTATNTATFVFFFTPTTTSTPITIQQLEAFPPTSTPQSPQPQAPQPAAPNVQGAYPSSSSSGGGLPLWLFVAIFGIAAILLVLLVIRFLRR